MQYKNKVIELANANNGLIFTKTLKDNNIPRYVLRELVNNEQLYYAQRGVYVTENGYVDDYFLLQQRFPKGVFSHETALFLLGYSDRVPSQIIMTFPHGQSSIRMKKANIKPIMISSDYDIGITNILHNGNYLRTYNIERTIIDLLKPRYDTDKEQFIPAIKQYSSSKEKDWNKLYNYASIFKLSKQLSIYMEVLI